jgi:hypothetical protein
MTVETYATVFVINTPRASFGDAVTVIRNLSQFRRSSIAVSYVA